ncbi:MAG: hydrogenase expression/formation C-terminal domain-containing protein [Pseudomonadota bacterium]|nr:hydrogenase expression/formation C-terminal domain-containing protein [Pseudomonadota bacterium]MDP1904704.1 hydrogenase expression/formation C-terminal domain-containing protein [Pseudomonadota bacterium]MDP2352894.1 hydrogenase expression/formation C-terminal domain-containing protein [Pseudomonadota bacterium]
MHAFPIPVVALGPGSQQEDEALDYLPMPHDMHTYRAPILPEPEEVKDRAEARVWLGRLLQAVRDWQARQQTVSLDMSGLGEADRLLIDQVLGEGEVGVQVVGEGGTLTIQESVFAGIWRLRGRDNEGYPYADRVEVGDVPAAVRIRRGLSSPVALPLNPGVVNAQALLTEIAEQVARPSADSHVINLSLLPFTPEDGAWLDQCLGRGQVTFLSRGYGNCRITATGIARVWWVQFFNSQDALILNTLEITDVPEVARAAPEDLADSAERLKEVLEWIS